MKNPELVILPSSPEAATRRTVEGWVSRDGHFYGDGPHNERTARYAGSTHSECAECGAMCEKSWTKCRACRLKGDIARFAARPKAPWDGVQMVYSDARDEYYNSPDDADDDLEEGQTLEDLRLVLCDPQRARQIDDEFFCDELPEEGDWNDLPKELQEAAEAYNKVAASCRPLSWTPGKFAMLIPPPPAASPSTEEMK